MRPAAPARAFRYSYGGLLLALFAFLLFARVHEATSTFLLLRDQMRDWTLALGPFRGLPLTGPQSTAGGASLGPVYYWVLWASRRLIGPWFQNLPYAGAYGIALLQGSADLLLLDTLRRRTGSLWIALAVTLLTATSAHELAVSSTIWNPAVAVAFVKLAMALRLRHDAGASLWWTAATTACAWFAVQSHSSAIFVAAPICASYVLDDLLQRRLRRALEQTRVIIEVIVLLQVPFLVQALTAAGEVAPTRAIGGAADALFAGALRWRESLVALVQSVELMLFAPWWTPRWTPILGVAGIIVLLRSRRDLPLLCCTVVPIAAGIAGFALWQGTYDAYWYLPLAPCAGVTMVLAVTAWFPGATAGLLIAALLVSQPARWSASHFDYRMPAFGPLLKGTQRIVRQTTSLRRLTTSFPMPPFSDETYLFGLLGGRLSDDAEFDAVIDEQGNVQFTRVPR